MVAGIEFEKRIASIGICGIVICKFSHWQEAYLIILFLVNKDSEICLYCAVLPFGLAISLRIESRREFSFDS